MEWWLIGFHVNHNGTADLVADREEQNVLSNSVSVEVYLIGTWEEVIVVLH
jgi:hypothetical protein